jgi:hypothetical protein
LIQATLDLNVRASGFLFNTGVPAERFMIWFGRAYELMQHPALSGSTASHSASV